MIRYLLRWIILLSGLFILPVLLIRAQPYDDSELRAFLTPPEGCPAPCFMGIRPGVTTTEEAIAILEAHEWVASVGEDIVKRAQEELGDEYPPTVAIIHWEWSGLQPAWIEMSRDARFVDEVRTVSAIVIDTNIPLGDVLFTYGIPDNARFVWSRGGFFGYSFSYDVWYAAHCIEIHAGGAGPPRHVYLRPVTIWFQAESPERDQVTDSPVTY